jgi:outer membrane receptor protein involved in Fe transport
MSELVHKLLIGSSMAVIAVAMPAGAAFAQNADVETVVVSGSRITTAGYSQPTPVTVVGEEQLQRDAYSNMEDVLRTLPQLTAPPGATTTNADQGSQGTGGTNFANLRNLGVGRTLVLFDSQRMVAATVVTNVDITTIPNSVVKRVDVVTGGASAAYGSDAVAGVVNFVLDKNITGIKGTVQYGETSNSMLRDFSGNVAGGSDFDGDRGHFEVAADYHVRPDFMLLTDAKYYRGAYWVSNPAYVAGNGQPQLIVANNVGEADAIPGGLITASPAGVAGAGVTSVAPANALRGIRFVGDGVPERINFGNLTKTILSNGGSLTEKDSQASLTPLSQPITTYALFGYARYKLTDNIQLSLQGNFSYAFDKGENVSTVQTNLTIFKDNAFLPASVASAMATGGIASFTLGTLNTNNFDPYKVTGGTYNQYYGAMAPAVYTNRRNTWRAVATLDGTLGKEWTWTAYALHAATRLSTHDLNVPIQANLQAAEDAVVVTAANRGTSGLALGSIACRSTLTGTPVILNGVTALPGCIPLNVFGVGVASQAAIDYVGGGSNNQQDLLHQSLALDVVEASMSGTLPFGLPAGDIATAFGAGYRKQQGQVWANALAASLAYGQGNSAIIPGDNHGPVSYNVWEGFAEVDVPVLRDTLVKSMDFNAAGRLTDYSTSGLVETWKLGATSQIDDNVKFRATYSVDIRAPQLAELYSSGQSGSSTRIDPKTQQSVFVFNQSPGNPNLNPEVANTWSVGTILTPTFVPGLSFSADWYNISLKGVITSVNAATILAACNPTLPDPTHPGQNGNINNPICSALTFAGPNGALSFINTGVQNFASQTTSGLDMSLNYDMDLFDGTLAWSAVANLNDESTLNNPGVGLNDSAGAQGFAKWKGILQATYSQTNWSFTAMARWYGSSVAAQDGNSGNLATLATANLYDPAHFHVPVSAFLDLRGNYQWSENLSFYAALDNALDLPPPLLPGLVAGPAGAALEQTQRAVYDELGRNIRVGVRFRY